MLLSQKVLTYLLAILFVIGLNLMDLHAQQKVIRAYVSPGIKSTCTGSIDYPFQSINQALQFLNKSLIKQNAFETAEIILRSGTYIIDTTIEITANLWVSKIPLVICPYRNEKVTIHGGRIIPINAMTAVTDTSFLKRFLPEVRNLIRHVSLKQLGVSNIGELHEVGFARPYKSSWTEAFFNKKPGILARWPNDSIILVDKILDTGSIPRLGDFSKRGGIFTYKDTNRPSTWKEPNKAWISGYFMWGYADDAIPLKTIDTATNTVFTALPAVYGFGTGKPWRGWYAYNIPEEIDERGEYYIDHETKDLYFLPPDSLNVLEISLLESPLMAIENVSNVTVKDIKFTCSRGMGLYLEGTENVLIQRCEFFNLGMMAISMGKGIEPFADLVHEGTGKSASRIVGSLAQHLYANPTYNGNAGVNNKITDCEIYQTGMGGIMLSGGDRLRLKAGNNTVQNCSIHDFNRLDKSYRPGVWISGVGNRIANCEIYNAPSMAILMHGNDHIIEYNSIHHVVLEVDDQGALYYGRDPSERGFEVRYNYFHHVGNEHRTHSVYHDDGACEMRVYGNIFFKAGRWSGHIGGGHDNTYENNIFIDAQFAIHVDNRFLTWAREMLEDNGLFHKRMNLVKYNQPPYSIRYPKLVTYWQNNPPFPSGNTISKNVLIRINKPLHAVDGDNSDESGFTMVNYKDDNIELNDDPGFFNFQKEDFRLKKTSIIYKKSPQFKAIPFERIGYRSQLKK